MKEAKLAQTSCIILSAGSSVRMGEHKALLKFNETSTFIQSITETYMRAGVEQIIVVVNTELNNLISEKHIILPESVNLVLNEKPGMGRFYSLQTGLHQVNPGNFCFFQNIDNPFTSAELLETLIKAKFEADVIIPVFQNKAGHPVLLSPLVTGRISMSADLDSRIDQVLKGFSCKYLETGDCNILANINSPEQFMEAGFRQHFDNS